MVDPVTPALLISISILEFLVIFLLVIDFYSSLEYFYILLIFNLYLMHNENQFCYVII